MTELLAAGAIREVGKDASGARKGRPSQLLAPALPGGRALSVDIGHTHVRAIVADASGHVVHERVVAFEERLRAERALAEAARLVTDVAAAAKVEADGVIGAVVGVPSPVDLAGRPVAPWFGDLDPLEALRLDAYTDRVRVLNDADLGAAGEAAFGAGSRFGTFVYVKISHGIGAGLIVGGRIYRGRGYAGNIGHIRMVDDGDVCICGNRGCLETVASSAALIKVLQPAHPGVSLGFADLVRLANAGDRGTRALLVDAGRTIGRALSTLVTAMNPDAILVGGAVGALGEPVLRGIREALDRYTHPAALHDLVVTGAGRGAHAEALGGIAVAFGLVEDFGSAGGRPSPFMS
ncbi:ROK family transcriptional regulator [Actinoallomurus oryzae]|uniref:ROK family transcriptional regulator n=1 Tax=Actinoallomurus oryzae TaxID=502180 RepID=A0ABP8Q2U4_9ACTN